MTWWLILLIAFVVVMLILMLIGNMILDFISSFGKDAVVAIVYQMNPGEYESAKKTVEEKYKGRLIVYKVYNNEQEFKAEYEQLIIHRKQCPECTVIPLGNVKYLTENLPIDFFDLTK